jgi:hypothetical protein
MPITFPKIIIPRVRLAPVSLALCLLVAGRAGADTSDRFVRTVAVDASVPIRIDATIADVTIMGSDRRDVAIEIVRRAPAAADLERYPVAVEQADGRLHITVVQRDDGRDAQLKTEIVLAIPSRTRIDALRVFEGRIRLSNLHGACDVDIRRGPIEATNIGGRVRLEAGIGSVDVKDAHLTPGGMMRLRVFNGPLKIRFARRPESGRILALTFNGTIVSDIPLTMKDKFGPRFGETTLGNADPVMSLDVVKGDIAIKVG